MSDYFFNIKKGDARLKVDKKIVGSGDITLYKEEGCPYARVGFLSQATYEEMMTFCTIVCADVIIVNLREQLLYLAKRVVSPAKNELWAIGGRRYAFEDPVKAAVRFLRDDAGINVSVCRIHFVTMNDYAWNVVKQSTVHGSNNLCFTFYVNLSKKEREQIVLDPKEYDIEFGLVAIGRKDLAKVSPPIRDFYHKLFGRK